MKRKYFIIALTILLMLLFCFPIFMAVLTSVKTQQEISRSILSFPTALHLENYTEAMERSDFTRSLINSCIVTFPSVALIIVGASMGGYAIARHAASCLLYTSECGLATIFVHPEHQGQGIGRIIIDTLEQDELFLTSTRTEIGASITACQFYEKMGYTYKDHKKALDRHGLYKMEKFKMCIRDSCLRNVAGGLRKEMAFL